MVTDTPASKVPLISAITESSNHSTFSLPHFPITSLELTAANYVQPCKGLAPVMSRSSYTIEEASNPFKVHTYAHHTLVERDAAADQKVAMLSASSRTFGMLESSTVKAQFRFRTMSMWYHIHLICHCHRRAWLQSLHERIQTG